MPYGVVWSGGIEMLGVYLASAKEDAGLTNPVNYTKNIAFRTDPQTEIVIRRVVWFMGGVELEFGNNNGNNGQ